MRQYHVGLVLTAAGFAVMLMLGRSLVFELAGGCIACLGAWIALRAERPAS